MVGILDIAKCLYEAITKLEHAYRRSSDRLEETVKKVALCCLQTGADGEALRVCGAFFWSWT